MFAASKEQRKDSKKVVKNLTNNEVLFTYGVNNKVATKVENCTPNEKITLKQLIQLIKSDVPSNALKVRQIVKKGFEVGTGAKAIKKQIKPLKNSLPFVLFSGFCPVHHNDNDLIYNGCLQIDIDFKFQGGDLKAIELKEIVKDLPFIVLAAVSPSGHGLKCLISTNNNDIRLHGDASKATINHLSNILNIDKIYFDNLGASQPCFIPFDKEVYFNPNYAKFDVFKALYELEQQKSKELSKMLENTRNIHLEQIFSDRVSVPTIETLKYLTSEITARNIDITYGYNDWFAIACSYASCGEAARGLFHTVSSINNEYDFNKNEKKYNEALKAKFNNIGLLVNRCKSYGITINDFCRNWIKENAPKIDNSIVVNDAVKQDFLLNKNQFIGSVLTARNFKKGINILTGGTGVGKTHFVANNFDKVVVVSRNITTLENYTQYGFGRFLASDENDYFIDLQDGNKITVTYKSLENLLNSTIDLDNHVFVFDEYHLLTDAYRDVRKETQYTYNILSKLQDKHTVILSSANDVFISDKSLVIQNKFTFRKPSVKRDVNVTYYANFTTLKQTINKRLLEGKKVLLYTNRKEEKKTSQQIKDSFPNSGIMFFDATKHDIDLTNLEHDITVCTKALTTGKDIKNDNLSVIIYCSDYDMKRSVINQFFGRARNYETATFDLLFTFKTNHKKYGNYDVNKMFNGCKNIAKSVIDASVNDIAFLHENDKHFVLKQDNQLVINHFAIDNHIENSISKYTIRNTDILSDFLKFHGYTPTIYELEQQETENKPTESKLTNSEKYTQEIELIFNGEADNHSFETNAQNRVEALQEIGFSQNESLLYALRFDSSMKWKRLINLFLSEIRLNTNDLSYQRDYEKALTAFDGDYLTTSEILDRIQKLRKTKTKLGRDIGFIKSLDRNEKSTQRTVLRILRQYFDIDLDRNEKTYLYKINESNYLSIKQRQTIHKNDIKKLFKLTAII